MKKILFAIVIAAACCPLSLHAQFMSISELQLATRKGTAATFPQGDPYDWVEQHKKQTSYDEKVKDYTTINVSFDVGRNGSFSNIEVSRFDLMAYGENHPLIIEALRLAKAMPRWKPVDKPDLFWEMGLMCKGEFSVTWRELDKNGKPTFDRTTGEIKERMEFGKIRDEDVNALFALPGQSFTANLDQWITNELRKAVGAFSETPDTFKIGVRFVVQPDGSISNVKWWDKTRETTPDVVAKEAIRIVENMPKWVPGKWHGKAIRVRDEVSINFIYNPPTAQSAQNAESAQNVQSETEDRVYDIAEQMPSFPGGPAALNQYLRAHATPPLDAEKKQITGRVVVSFVVNKDGSMSDFKIVTGSNPVLKDAAIEVLRGMPKWIPGKKDGEVVRVKTSIPITFN